MKVVDYRVIESTDRGPLVTEVNDYLKRGYELYGELLATDSPSGGVSRYIQVVVRFGT